MAAEVPAPNYPTPDYGQFGAILGNLANTYRAGQRQNMQLDQEKAFQGGVPMTGDGQPDYAKIMQTLAQKGDINSIGALAGPLLAQRQMAAGGVMSPLLMGGFGGGSDAGGGSPQPPAQPMGDLPPASAGAATRTAPPALGAPSSAPNQGPFGNISGVSTSGATLADMTSKVVADPEKAPMIASLVAKALKVDPGAQLTPEQADRAQRILANYAQRTGGATTQTEGADGQYPNTQEGHAAFIAARAAALGIDPKFALAVASAEGLRALSPKNPNGASTVDRNPDGTPFSFGDFQLNVRNGLGTEARKQGIDPANPNQWQQADEYALETMAKGGLGPWKGDAAVSAYQRQGGGWQAPRVAGGPAVAAITNATGGQPQVAQAAPAPQGGGPRGGAIIPQVPLPKGYTDPQKAILAIDQEIARLGANPYAKGQVSALEDWRERIAKSTTPVEVSPGRSFVDPSTGKTTYTAPYPTAAGMTPAAQDVAAQTYYETGKLPPNMGRGLQGSANMMAIINRAAELHPDDPPEAWANRWQTFQSGAAGKRLLATRTASLELAENEAKSLIPRVHDASIAVNRTQYPTLNKVIEAAQTGTGDPNVIRLGIAVESLAQVYARVLNPVGVPTAADKANAHEILDKAWSTGQIDAALDQMAKEIQSAKSSLETTKDEIGGAGKPKGGDGASSATSGPGNGQGQPKAAPKPNDIEQGYRFKGGDPADKNNWEKVN